MLASTFGPQWSLRYAFLVFVGATILAILLPAQVDSSAGEDRSRARKGTARPAMPRSVVVALRSNTGMRLLSGFLTMFMAFLLRDKPFPGWEDKLALLLGLVIGSAELGSAIGIGLGSVLRRETRSHRRRHADRRHRCRRDGCRVLQPARRRAARPHRRRGPGARQAVAGRPDPAQGPRARRASTFARSETLLQLSWVVGGFLGIALPLIPTLGLGVLAAILVGWTVWTLTAVRRGDLHTT